MERENLLVSKSYGLGQHKFWQLGKDKEVREIYGAAPEIRKLSQYAHELIRAEVFTVLYLTRLLQTWEEEAALFEDKTANRADARAWFGGKLFYLEFETGSQFGGDKWEDKISQYRDFYSDTREDFRLIFVVPDMKCVDKLAKICEDLRCPYLMTVCDDFLKDPLNTTFYYRPGLKKTTTLAEITKKKV